jgi:hypothetical protein
LTIHILGFAYKPKDVGVSEGYIRQTIRTLSVKPRKVEDDLLLHGWKGPPYHSNWSWRRRESISELIPIRVTNRGFYYLSDDGNQDRMLGVLIGVSLWECPNADRVAFRDGIVPPTGLELKKVLKHYAGWKRSARMDIIRW